MGKDSGDDFREGKVTLPVLLAYGRGSRSDREFWTRSLIEGRTDECDLEHARELMDTHNCLVDTIERANHYASIAHDALLPLGESEEKGALLEALAFCISRAH